MVFKKRVISDGILATSSVIKLVYDDSSIYEISSIKYKTTNDISYIIYTDNENNNLFEEYNKMVELLAKNYKTEIIPVYYDDSESFISILKLYNMKFEFIYDRENNCISLLNKDGNMDGSFSDNLAVYITYNLIESIFKKNTLGSDR